MMVFRSIALATGLFFSVVSGAFAQSIQAASEAYFNGDYAVAVAEARPLAESGDPDAQYILGSLYYDGLGVPEDRREAARWHRLAAEQNHPHAQFALATQLISGQGVERDDIEAVRLFRLSAEQNHPQAQAMVGVAYYQGFGGLERNYEEAILWLRPSAEYGVTLAEQYLGMAFQAGNGVPQDFSAAIDWYARAAAGGSMFARYSLGWLLEHGPESVQDHRLAMIWMMMAADQGQVDAPQELARMYLIEVELSESVEVVRINFAMHYMWASIAQARGQDTGTLDLIAQTLPQDQLAEAQALVAQCIAQNFQNCVDLFFSITE